jgi:peptide/nickel transport system permease protein
VIRRFAKSRAMRKFRHNRLAMVAMVVIALYLLIGLAALGTDAAGAIGKATGWFDLSSHRLLRVLTLAEAEQVVGPSSLPGLQLAQKPEKRLQDCRLFLDAIEKALAPVDRAAKRRQRNGEPMSGEEIEAEKRAALREVRFAEERVADTSLAKVEEALDKAAELGDKLDESADLDKDPERWPTLAELESVVASLYHIDDGIDQKLYDFRLSLGTDRQGRSIMVRAVYSIKVAIQIGLVVALISVLLGSVIGAAAAFFGGWVDHLVVWLYSTLSSVPDLVLLAVLVFMFTGSIFDDVTRPWLSLVPVYAAMCMTFWIGPCRIVRGETMKVKELEYVQAATAIGFGRFYILLKHVLPNTLHLMFISFSLLFIAAIKFEVVLSFLGLGVKVGPSWGRMIQESTQEVINQFFWQIGAATVFMFFLVLAFNIVSDALQDAFDPKHVG